MMKSKNTEEQEYTEIIKLSEKVYNQIKPKTIKIEYDGRYPNLCSGNLCVVIDDEKYQFPSFCLRSGGYVSFDENWNADVGYGEWSVSEWPINFPEYLKSDVLKAINDHIPQGCCGGCV